MGHFEDVYGLNSLNLKSSQNGPQACDTIIRKRCVERDWCDIYRTWKSFSLSDQVSVFSRHSARYKEILQYTLKKLILAFPSLQEY